MCSHQFKFYDVVDIPDSVNCIIVFSSGFIDYTRYLICHYASKINANCKITCESNQYLVIYYLLSVYQRLIVLEDQCCVNSSMPDLFEQVEEHELGGVSDQSGNNLKTGLYIISRQHRYLFGDTNQVPRSFPISLISPISPFKLLDQRYNNSIIGLNVNLDQRQVVDDVYIKDNYMMNIGSDYKHQLFYIKQICDIYSNRFYYVQGGLYDFDLIDDVCREIATLKRNCHRQLKILIIGDDNPIWSQIAQHKINKVIYMEKSLNSVLLSNSFTMAMTDKVVPISLRNEVFDLIIINNLECNIDTHNSVLIPIYWACQFLSTKGTIIYMCQSNRLFEHFCINKYFNHRQFKKVLCQQPIAKFVKC